MAYKLLVTIIEHRSRTGDKACAMTTTELSFGSAQERTAARDAIDRVYGYETNVNPLGMVRFAEYEASDPTVYVLRVFKA
jgi:hypothetical protein